MIKSAIIRILTFEGFTTNYRYKVYNGTVLCISKDGDKSGFFDLYDYKSIGKLFSEKDLQEYKLDLQKIIDYYHDSKINLFSSVLKDLENNVIGGMWWKAQLKQS